MKLREKTKKRKWGLIILALIFTLLLAIGTYVFIVYQHVTKTFDAVHTEIERTSPLRNEKVQLENSEAFTVLMLGVDERKGDRGRSDSMIVLAVNPQKESVKMLSIPRDTRTEIIGRGTVDKINHAFAFGGVKMSMDTVEQFLQVPIDYFMQINMEGFKDIVDAVGGITVNNTLNFTSGGTHFPEGTISLDGSEALSFSRMRYEDPNGDFGRQQRQRAVISAILKEAATISTLTKYQDILGVVEKNLQTNMKFDEMLKVQSKYRNAFSSIDELTISGSDAMIDNIWYFEVTNEEKMRIQQIFKDYLK